MKRTVIETRLLPISILGLSAYAFSQPHRLAWQWVIVTTIVLAILAVIRAVLEWKQVFDQRLSINLTVFVVTKIMLPVLVILIGLVALVGGRDSLLDAATIMAITFAVVSLL